MPTPADILARRGRLIVAGDADGFADLFTADAVIEFAFHGPPAAEPVRLAGREAIREYSRRIMASPLRVSELEVVALHQTQDPEVVVAEVRATATAADRTFTATSIQILRFRDGRIALFRDFADPRLLEYVTGDGPG